MGELDPSDVDDAAKSEIESADLRSSGADKGDGGIGICEQGKATVTELLQVLAGTRREVRGKQLLEIAPQSGFVLATQAFGRLAASNGIQNHDGRDRWESGVDRDERREVFAESRPAKLKHFGPTWDIAYLMPPQGREMQPIFQGAADELHDGAAHRDPETQKRRQRWRSGFPTKANAEKALRRALGRLDAGDDPIPTNIALSEFAGRWLGHLEATDSPRPNSRRRYAELLYQRVVPLIGGMRLDRIRPAHVQAVLDAATEAGLSPATVQKIRAAMSSMFNMAVKWTAHLVESSTSYERAEKTFPEARHSERIGAPDAC